MQVYVDESERRYYLLCAFLARGDVGRVRRAVGGGPWRRLGSTG